MLLVVSLEIIVCIIKIIFNHFEWKAPGTDPIDFQTAKGRGWFLFNIIQFNE